MASKIAPSLLSSRTVWAKPAVGIPRKLTAPKIVQKSSLPHVPKSANANINGAQLSSKTYFTGTYLEKENQWKAFGGLRKQIERGNCQSAPMGTAYQRNLFLSTRLQHQPKTFLRRRPRQASRCRCRHHCPTSRAGRVQTKEPR